MKPKAAGIVFFLTTFIFTVYSFSLGHNFLFDEENIILFNPLVRDLSHWPRVFSSGYFSVLNPGASLEWSQYYRPLTLLTFLLNYAVGGTNPLGYNLVNLLLHVLVSIGFYFLLEKIFKNRAACFLGAMLFALHPVQTEAVSYVASRGDLMCAFFLVACLLFYWEKKYTLAVLCYPLAYFSKEGGLLLPLYLILLDRSFFKTKFKDLGFRMMPYAALGAGYLILRQFWVSVPLGPADSNVLEGLMRVLSMGNGLMSYAQAIIAPQTFKFCESLNFSYGTIQPVMVLTALFYGAILFLMIRLWRRGGWPLFALSIPCISLLPALQFVEIAPHWAEHYLYLTMMALGLALAGVFATMNIAKKSAVYFLVLSIVLGWIGFLTYRTIERNRFYASPRIFYHRLILSDSPYAHFGFENLARYWMERNEWGRALAYLRPALKKFPDYDNIQFNAGLCESRLGRTSLAIEYFKEASRLNPKLPMYLMNAAILEKRRGNFAEAEKLLLTIEPQMKNESVFYRSLASALEFSGKPKEALAVLAKGLELSTLTPDTKTALQMEIILLSFREGWFEDMKQSVNQFAVEHRGEDWYALAGQLLSNEIGLEEYRTQLSRRYPGTEEASWPYVLATLTLKNDKIGLSIFLERNASRIRSESEEPVIVDKFLIQARKILE